MAIMPINCMKYFSSILADQSTSILQNLPSLSFFFKKKTKNKKRKGKRIGNGHCPQWMEKKENGGGQSRGIRRRRYHELLAMDRSILPRVVNPTQKWIGYLGGSIYNPKFPSLIKKKK